MTEPGSGDDDDPQLRAMRSVWLSMPDEDPPSRGFAELMAAARVKADELATPPWWKRVADLLRRPTVLALASVMVLIAGAVFVTQRKDLSEAPVRMRSEGSAASEPMDRAAGAPEKAEKPEKLKTLTDTPVVTTPPPAPPAASPSPARPATPRPIAPAHAIPPSPHAGFVHHDSPPGADLARPRTQPTEAPGAVDGLAKEDESEAAPTTRGPTQVLVGQLLEQCRSAATRGDCEAAKLIAKRIAKQDASYYKEHVATDAAISKCVAAE